MRKLTKNATTVKKIGIFISLMSVIIIAYICGMFFVEKNKCYFAVGGGTITIDCVEIIDKHGVDKEYLVEFYIQVSVPGEILVCLTADDEAKYTFSEYIYVGSNKKEKFSMIVSPSVLNEYSTEAYLSFLCVDTVT